MSVTDRLRAIQTDLAQECTRIGRNPAEITLIAVSKNHPVELIQQAYEAGHRDFGESRVQELQYKTQALPPDIRWHFIGHLQSNKAALAAELCHAIHTISNPRQLNQIAKTTATIQGFVQVNIGREEQKSGIFQENLDTMVQHVLKCQQVQFRGLMTIGPAVSDPEEGRIIFRQLAELNRRVGGRQLSMGMSHDYRVALQEGATHIRIGTAIFGTR